MLVQLVTALAWPFYICLGVASIVASLFVLAFGGVSWLVGLLRTSQSDTVQMTAAVVLSVAAGCSSQ